ncbi:mannosyltransferase [Pedobacter sp. BAL39]|uniref:glycosyltransferase family 4 protein n=1 Tax=Pedobacter sp. BAL39 TaxID=391596 RepID=UPI00015596F4|nr:glycosyltransferase family 1 protein [Pedobacter sp. BAL39]EDM37561.1 mannosyltransferase [Pedobacter sp. BAL39]
MINILSDHQIFDMQRFGGISRYFANIYHHLKTDKNYSNELSILKTSNYYLEEDTFSANPIVQLFLKKQRKQAKFNRKYSLKKVSGNRFDLFHPTYYDPYFLGALKKPFVLTVHDMIHEIYPIYFASFDQFARYKRETIQRADHIIAISETTKQDLQHFFPIPDEKITVVYHGVDIKKKQDQPLLENIDFPYILYIGDRSGYKNFYTMATAFKEISNSYKDVQLVCTGSPFNSVETEFLIRSGISEKVVHISATDTDLQSLYQHAVFYINPSLLEGFGFPILEAYENECMVLLSDTSCFHEIAGEAAMYFDPNSVQDISSCMSKAIDDLSVKKKLIGKGKDQLLKFPLQKSMQETINVYSKILNR